MALEFCELLAVLVTDVRVPLYTCTANWVSFFGLVLELLLPRLLELAREGKFFLVGLTAGLTLPVLTAEPLLSAKPLRLVPA